jgi:hypothetical protein
MVHFILRRQPVLYATTGACMVVLHGFLCHPAAICRGYPPIKPHELIAIFIAPFGMLMPAFFDDARNDRYSRWLRSAYVATGFCWIWGAVEGNFASGRPSMGHLQGMAAVMFHPAAVLYGAFYFPVAIVFFYCLDGVAIWLWSMVRRFREDEVG